jgi:CubicO group peptidase (beta-lactamase class C family)
VGEVHDEKAFQLGGVSGSAGLFSNAHDLHKYTAIWLHMENQKIISPELMKQSINHPFHNRGLGWEIWSGVGSIPSCGSKWAPGSFGHTGFTGTSLWMDPANQLSVILLTNAVHFGRANPIRLLRIQLHDLIDNMKGALLGG